MQSKVKLFGPPGTGKTHRLLEIMERELAGGVKPQRLAYLTFTKAARHEAKSRAAAKFGYGEDELPFFRTLHSVAFMQLGVVREGLVRGGEQLAPLGERLGVEFSDSRWDLLRGDTMDFGSLPGDQLLALDHLRRHRQLTVEDMYRAYDGDDVTFFELQRFVEGYAAWKREEALLDFTDLLMEPLPPLPIDVAIVDEAQDLSLLQWAAMLRLTAGAKRVYMAGDDDQAIYHWAGADASAFLAQPGEPAFLTQSYRLPRAVMAQAKKVLARIQHRQAKPWEPRDADGEVRWAFDFEDAEIPDTGSVLVLYRNHYQANPVAEHLRQRGVAFSARDAAAPGAMYVRAILGWNNLLAGHPLRQAEAVLVYDAIASRRGIDHGGKALLERADHRELFTKERLRTEFGLTAAGPWHQALTRIPREDVQYIVAVERAEGLAALANPRVRLSTMHAAKGAEADHVLLLTGMARRVREGMERNPDGERRVWYVGVTRAKETLTICGPDDDDLGLD